MPTEAQRVVLISYKDKRYRSQLFKKGPVAGVAISSAGMVDPDKGKFSTLDLRFPTMQEPSSRRKSRRVLLFLVRLKMMSTAQVLLRQYLVQVRERVSHFAWLLEQVSVVAWLWMGKSSMDLAIQLAKSVICICRMEVSRLGFYDSLGRICGSSSWWLSRSVEWPTHFQGSHWRKQDLYGWDWPHGRLPWERSGKYLLRCQSRSGYSWWRHHGQKAILKPKIRTALKAALVPSLAEKNSIRICPSPKHSRDVGSLLSFYTQWKSKSSRKLAVGSRVRQGEADVVWIWFSKSIKQNNLVWNYRIKKTLNHYLSENCFA